MPWGAAIMAGGAIVSGAMQSKAAGKAADSVAEGTADSIAEQRRQYDTTRADYADYLAAGKKALGTLAAENDVALDTSKIQMDPGYQFGLSEGQKGIDRQTAAAGGRISGAALKAAAQYNTNYANTGYDAAYNRANTARTDRLNRLAALANVGQTTTGAVTAAGNNTTNAITALTTNGANNAGAAQIAKGNIWGDTANQLTALYGRGATK